MVEDGSGETKTLSLIYPQKKKSQSVRSGLLDGQRINAMLRSVEQCVRNEVGYHIDICRVTKG
jgi:hypothetical protein